MAKHFRARHTEFGKYKCKECPYLTSQKPNLDFHYKFKHEVINTEACTMCFYTTPSEDLMRRHVKMVHDKWRYIECMACDYQVRVVRLRSMDRLDYAITVWSLPNYHATFAIIIGKGALTV